MEFKQFSKFRFYYNPEIWISGKDYSAQHREIFDRDLDSALQLINSLIEDLNSIEEDNEPIINEEKSIERIFISHSVKDKNYVEELIDILESMRIASERIFYSSFEGYGIPLGKDFLQTIKEEISGKDLVIFVLSKNFYESINCICEMGAVWVLSNEHIPILIPPFDYKDIEGVIDKTQSMKINETLKYDSLKDMLTEKLLLTPQTTATWERKRDRALSRINQMLMKESENARN